jgi:hypothetical protein
MNFRPASRNRHLWDTWFYDNHGEYHLFYLSNPVEDDGSRRPWDAFSLAITRDFLHWEEKGEVFTKSSDPLDWDSEIITTGDIIKFRDRFYMSYRATTKRIEKNNIIVSDDLLNWRRISKSPVLETSLPYEFDPTRTVNNYVEMRDVTMTELPDGAVEGIFTARIDSGPHTGRGVLGRAHTNDMIRWDLGEPIFSPGIFNVIEVPSRYSSNGRHYLLYCVNSYLESHLGNNTYPNMRFCTGYAMSDRYDDGFTFVSDQVLGIGDAYVGRIVDAGGETLFIHHLVSSRPAFCFPKTVVFENDGTIHLGYWKGVEDLFTGTAERGFQAITPGTSNEIPICTCQISEDTCTLENNGGFGEAYLEGKYSDFVLDVTIDMTNCRSAGILLNTDMEAKSGVFLSLERADNLLQIGSIKKTYGHIAPDDAKHEYRIHRSDTILKVKVVSRSEGFDWYLDGRHVFTTVDEMHLDGSIGLFVREGYARFSQLVIQRLQAEDLGTPT